MWKKTLSPCFPNRFSWRVVRAQTVWSWHWQDLCKLYPSVMAELTTIKTKNELNSGHCFESILPLVSHSLPPIQPLRKENKRKQLSGSVMEKAC